MNQHEKESCLLIFQKKANWTSKLRWVVTEEKEIAEEKWNTGRGKVNKEVNEKVDPTVRSKPNVN